jgi:hypothetical protein
METAGDRKTTGDGPKVTATAPCPKSDAFSNTGIRWPHECAFHFSSADPRPASPTPEVV